MGNKVALITGASRGIGRAIAEVFAKNGISVALTATKVENVQNVADNLSTLGVKAFAYACNVAEHSSIIQLFDAVVKDMGKIDILVNNAGITKDTLLLRMKEEDWDAVINVNLRGIFFSCKEAVKLMSKQKYGRIINISSIVGLMGNAGQANYCASKAGIIGFTKAIAKEYASRGITVNAIAPGFVDTDMTASLSDDVKAQMLKAIPIGRFGTPHDIAYTALFLASDEASYITGQVINVNGGMYM